MAVVMLLLESYRAGAANTPQPEQFAWLFLTSLIGAWAVLIPSKLWEGARGDPMLRRFVMMVLGMAIGAAAFFAADLLLVNLPAVVGYPKTSVYQLPSSFYAFDGRPLLLAYVACFGTLFLVIRWWRQADPLRRTRLRLWTLFASVLAAGVVAWAWQFPQPWLPMIAGTISVAVQLASPWERPKRRRM